MNVIGLLNVLEAGRQHGLKRVIFASSGGTVYGEQEQFPADERHPTRPLSPYGVAKLAAEHYLYYYSHQYGIAYVVLRYANVYGPRQSPHGEAGVVAIFVQKMLNGGQPIMNGDGRQTRDYVHVDDVTAVNRLALEEGVRGIYNVGTGIETDVNTIFATLKRAMGASCAEDHAPAKPGEQQRSAIHAARLQSELGWNTAVPLAEGMQRTVKWFQGQR